MYRVLHYKLHKTQDVSEWKDSKPLYFGAPEVVELGTAKDFADAYRKFPRGRINGYSHVLEAIGPIH